MGKLRQPSMDLHVLSKSYTWIALIVETPMSGEQTRTYHISYAGLTRYVFTLAGPPLQPDQRIGRSRWSHGGSE